MICVFSQTFQSSGSESFVAGVGASCDGYLITTVDGLRLEQGFEIIFAPGQQFAYLAVDCAGIVLLIRGHAYCGDTS